MPKAIKKDVDRQANVIKNHSLHRRTIVLLFKTDKRNDISQNGTRTIAVVFFFFPSSIKRELIGRNGPMQVKMVYRYPQAPTVSYWNQLIKKLKKNQLISSIVLFFVFNFVCFRLEQLSEPERWAIT